MGKIRILSPELINQIAAGEVVERPASVVKELVENAMDARATRIDITVTEGGRNLRIADNGSGMDADDLNVAFRNHATSKVQSVEDLFALNTLGFRGEALASIAAISKVTCTTRQKSMETGLKALVAPSGDVTLSDAGCAEGTIFDVQELFYNVPARLKFLKRPQTELSHIQETLQMLALSHPEIAFKLTLEGANSLKTSGSGDLLKAIGEVFSLADSELLLPFELEDTELGYKVWGHTSTPNVTRGSKKWMMTFVNGRAIKCPILGKAIETAYQSLMTPGRYPITTLFLEIPPEEVDVNVHPTKREVKYQHANTLFSLVRKALDVTFVEWGQAQRQTSVASEPTVFSGSFQSSATSAPAKSFASSPVTNYSRPVSSVSSPATSRIPDAPSYPQAAMELYEPTSDPVTPYLPQVSEYRIIGQMAKTYILVENADGLLIVDQHIAAERVNFERFMEQLEKSAPASQQLFIPMTFPVSPTMADQLETYRDDFSKLGFTYHFSEDGMVHFTTVPALYNEKVLKTSLQELLAHLEETSEVKLSVDDVVATAACHSSVRAGDSLNYEQMQRIVEQWFACTRPWTCPHGRPVSHQMTHRHIMNFFDRPSLPTA